MLMTKMVVPCIPRRATDGGYFGGFIARDDASTLEPMSGTEAGGAGGDGGGAATSTGRDSLSTTGGSSGGGGTGLGRGGDSVFGGVSGLG